MSSSYNHKFHSAQKNRTLIHPRILPNDQPKQQQQQQDQESPPPSSSPSSHTFVVCADTQFGMTSGNQEWETEIEYSRTAIAYINNMNPRPLFCCVCGDLVDMGSGGMNEIQPFPSRTERNSIQQRQRQDFQNVWSTLHPSIALICVCGNHDVGNTPTRSSIESFQNMFGDDYLSFWSTPTSYNIVLNTCLFSDPSGAPELYKEQLVWLQQQLEYASMKTTTLTTKTTTSRSSDGGGNGQRLLADSSASTASAAAISNQTTTTTPPTPTPTTTTTTSIFVFGHHPWFLYDEKEDVDTLQGYGSTYAGYTSPDSYFHIPKQYRDQVLRLFQRYNVTAAFAGHFHQNVTSKTSWGMDMIVTSSLSVVLDSTGNTHDKSTVVEPKNTRGLRIVTVDNTKVNSFQHKFVPLP